MQNWQKVTPQLKKQMSAHDQNWLLKPYVLTRHLKQVCEDYRFEVLEQKQATFNVDERELLQSDQGIVREIVHRNAEHAQVYGRTCIPPQTYQAYEEQFGSLEDNPIGESLLFFNREVKRGPFQYKLISPDTEGFEHCFVKTKHKQLWTRRSIFYWRGLPLLVTEIFMPDTPLFKPLKNLTTGVYCVKEKLMDYAYLVRLHRPIPILLMFWPTMWALWLASGGIPKIKYLIIFTLGVLLMRSCGDILNDLADRKLDGFIERTKMRPLATGRLRVSEALTLAFVLALLSFGLVLMLNTLSIVLAFVGLALAVLYPFMKRVTYLPQVVLGVAYNWGIIMAYAAVQNHIPWFAWYLLLITVIWTVAYDTFYAMADLPDDLKTGIKSTAVLFHPYNTLIIGILQVLTLLGFLSIAWVYQFAWPFVVLTLFAVPLFIFQQWLIRQPNIKRCIQAFNNNHWVGLLIFVAIAISV